MLSSAAEISPVKKVSSIVMCIPANAKQYRRMTWNNLPAKVGFSSDARKLVREKNISMVKSMLAHR
jgi:hypothetical protein